jgi:hypothetical protein
MLRRQQPEGCHQHNKGFSEDTHGEGKVGPSPNVNVPNGIGTQWERENESAAECSAALEYRANRAFHKTEDKSARRVFEDQCPSQMQAYSFFWHSPHISRFRSTRKFFGLHRLGAGLHHDAIRFSGRQSRLGDEPRRGLFQIEFNFPLAGSAVTVTTCAGIDGLQRGIVEGHLYFAVRVTKNSAFCGSDSRNRPPLGPATIFSA